jgi:DNA-binding IclR family transcriptional regulator
MHQGDVTARQARFRAPASTVRNYLISLENHRIVERISRSTLYTGRMRGRSPTWYRGNAPHIG